MSLDGLAASSFFLVSFVKFIELLSPAFGESRTLIWAHEGPVLISLDTSHKEIWDPESVEEITSSVLFLSVILTQLEVVVNISVPWLKVYREGSTALTTTLVNVAGSVIEDLKHGDEPVRVTICTTDVAVRRADVSNGATNASRRF